MSPRPEWRSDDAPGQVVLPEKQWISSVEEWQLVALTQSELASHASNVVSRRTMISFLLWAYGGLLACSMVIFFLQGFHLWGFALEISTLNWLGAATVGEIAGLLTIAMRFLFESKRSPQPSSAALKRPNKRKEPAH